MPTVIGYASRILAAVTYGGNLKVEAKRTTSASTVPEENAETHRGQPRARNALLKSTTAPDAG